MVKFAIAALLVVAAAAPTACGGDIQLLDFSSPFCGPCQSMVPVIQSLEGAGYPVRRVDTTQEQGVAQQYHVSQIPCFIMLVNGRETERMVGATGQDQLVAMFQRAMQVRAQSPDPQVAAPAPAVTRAPQPVADPWSGVGSPAPAAIGGDAPARESRPMTHTAPLGPREPLTDALANELIGSSVRLRVDDPTGQSYGTGTIIDSRSGEALIITCGHLFRDSKGKGPITVELFTATSGSATVAAQLTGQLVDFNLDRDIGLVSIRPTNPVRVAPIASTNTIIERGERLTSVGCDRGQNPTALATRVTNVDRYQGPPNIEASGAPIEGRSGGGLFNSNGQLVGVCFAADYEGNEGLYTALESIHDELDRLNLSDVYRGAASPATSSLSADPSHSPATTATPPIVRGQEPMQPVMPLAANDAAPPTALASANSIETSATAPAGLKPVEQAALEEIMRRTTDSEVVCIIRPHDPSGQSEVITLQHVSPEFVRSLAARSGTAPATLSR